MSSSSAPSSSHASELSSSTPPPAGRGSPRIPAGGEPLVVLLDDNDLGKTPAHEAHRPVARAVVDDDRLDAAHALERVLEPRQRVVRHDYDARVRRSPSSATIPAPGSASAIVTTKNRKPVANAGSAATPRAPRKETKNVSRTARPLIVNGTSMTRKSSGPIT